MSSIRPANHHRVQDAGDVTGQPLNRLFERHRTAGRATLLARAVDEILGTHTADEAVRFGIGGAEYEIDLSKERHGVPQAVDPYIEHARKAGRGQRRRPVRIASSRERSGGIRGWAKDQGIASAPAGVSLPALLSSMKPPRENPDAA